MKRKWKEFKYQICRPYYKTKHFIQRGKHGWSDADVWNADNYLAGVIADILEWYTSDKSTGVSMRYAYDLDTNNPDMKIMVERRNTEYLKYAAIFREYSVNGSWELQKDIDQFGGVLDKDMDEALQWLSKIYTGLWD